jgi:SNF2 family DNA or RNA helicase
MVALLMSKDIKMLKDFKKKKKFIFLLNLLKCTVAILSLTASSLGLTLTATSTVIFAEMSWTPATLLQAEDRAHRL